MASLSDIENYFAAQSQLRLAAGKSALVAPPLLLQLAQFIQQECTAEFFAESVELFTDGEKIGLKSYSQQTAFLAALHEFASADGSGSSYAIWCKDNDPDLNKAPVVVFGGEGGFHLVAENFSAFLQLLSFDAEPMIDWDEVDYYKPDDFNASAKHADYCRWLQMQCGLNEIEDANVLVAKAQQRHAEDFSAWMARFYQGHL